MTREDDLETLGLTLAATDTEIRAAYRAQAWRHHPDLGGDTVVMAAIGDAYQRLLALDPTRPEVANPCGQAGGVRIDDDSFTLGRSLIAFVVVPVIVLALLMVGVNSVLSAAF